jgi:hypothetical protein
MAGGAELRMTSSGADAAPVLKVAFDDPLGLGGGEVLREAVVDGDVGLAWAGVGAEAEDISA